MEKIPWANGSHVKLGSAEIGDRYGVDVREKNQPCITLF